MHEWLISLPFHQRHKSFNVTMLSKEVDMLPFVKFALKEPLGLSGTRSLLLNCPTIGNAGRTWQKLSTRMNLWL